jgi:hypothetical protein
LEENLADAGVPGGVAVKSLQAVLSARQDLVAHVAIALQSPFVHPCVSMRTLAST